ncbi:putative sds23 moc1 protein [Botryosphaeria dothidea]|uniref:Ribosome assembly protein 3 n=1 Tax=Botryosphaeria dothidea TaxID=55169 RepID=A0A8H4IYY0_9PEZI|nr:putative sds23 moc1 protein [Botryosphaeria dothidea]
MAPKKNPATAGKPKLNSKRSRKSRTEIFESSSSSSDTDTENSNSSSSLASDSDDTPTPAKKQKTTTTARDTSAPSPSPSPSGSEILPASAAAAAFPSWYLRTVTQELAEDLDKVRNAPDFGDAALPLLVHALQQGEGCFSAVEKARVMVGGRG